MGIGVLSACIFIHHMCTVLVEVRRGVAFPKTGVITGCQLPCEYKELISVPLEEQPVATEPSLQLPKK